MHVEHYFRKEILLRYINILISRPNNRRSLAHADSILYNYRTRKVLLKSSLRQSLHVAGFHRRSITGM